MATIDEVPVKTFILHWLGGSNETVKGYTISDAFMKAGYGGGAIRALDWYEEVKTTEESENV